ncbi:peptidase inhibitor 16-like [Myxocyprinus asiaticus]|uniref:peptidase inhibitor 16-like n=1 Tax=Myxocyprinus asiaticus TaxID=70543 RepID=UPI002221ED20|nr:peptidase inhibitor 16-like [Myxocyprinus asiaticus]
MHRNVALQCVGLWVILNLVASHLTEDQKSTIVNMHNEFRSKVQPSAAFMQKVMWDEELRLVAEAYASKCTLYANPQIKELSIGESLFASDKPFNATEAMLDWFGERVDYDYENNACLENPMCPLYTQMVWANSNKVGCATYLCDTVKGLVNKSTTVLVCNYFPQGNVKGQRPYESGEPCSKCQDNLSVCEENICVVENMFSSVEPLSEDPEHSTVSPEGPLATEEPTTLPEELTEVHGRINDTSLERSRSEIQSASAPLLLVVWLLAALIL